MIYFGCDTSAVVAESQSRPDTIAQDRDYDMNEMTSAQWQYDDDGGGDVFYDTKCLILSHSAFYIYDARSFWRLIIAPCNLEYVIG